MRDQHQPLGVIRDALAAGVQDVILGVSGGKDSVVALDLCSRHFRRTHCYFQYVVAGLSFQDRYLAFLERRYHVTIDRVPHPMLSRIMRDGTFRHETRATSTLHPLRQHHFVAWMRARTGLHWLAGGEKASDSLERNASMVRDGAIQPARGRLFPLAWWSTSDVESYLAARQVPLPPDYRLGDGSAEPLRRRRGASFGGLIVMREILKIAEHFPNDYAKIRQQFSFIDTQLQRWRQLNERGLVGGEKNEAGESDGPNGTGRAGEPEAETSHAPKGAGAGRPAHD